MTNPADTFLCPTCHHACPADNPAKAYAVALEDAAKGLQEAQTALLGAMGAVARALPRTEDIQHLHEAARRMGYRDAT